MKDRGKGFVIGLIGFFIIFLCCGASYWLWNSLGTVIQQWVVGALAVLTGYYVIGIILSVVVIGAIIALVIWANNR